MDLLPAPADHSCRAATNLICIFHHCPEFKDSKWSILITTSHRPIKNRGVVDREEYQEIALKGGAGNARKEALRQSYREELRRIFSRQTVLESRRVELALTFNYPSQRRSKPFSGDNRNILFCIFH